MQVKKAVIPAAGLGTRFLPATKAVPKEMLPIVDIPTIQLVIQEAVDSGIEEIILINGRGKNAIEDHFDIAYELEDTLRKRDKIAQADTMRQIANMVRIVSVRQKEPLGLGHAVLCAKSIVGDEPFAVLLGDDLYLGKTPAIGQLTSLYQSSGKAVLATMKVPKGQEHLYGVVAGPTNGDGHIEVSEMVEKPAPGTAPSQQAVVGRYVLPAKIFEILETIPRGKGNEYQLTDALACLAKEGSLLAMEVQGERHDAGDKLGYLRANLAYALERPELREGLKSILREMSARAE